MSAVAAEHLCKQYREFTAVDDVSFEVAQGEIVALLGPNGAGKTTTIEILEGFLAPTGGVVTVLGVDPRRGDRRWRSRIGFVLQSTSLDLQLTVREAIAAYAAVFPRPRPVSEVLDLIDLRDDADTRIGQLSGGQQRRVDLGLGIVGSPDLLFLDEPTTGLDPAARRHTWNALEALARNGTTILLSTHSLQEAEQLADRLLVLAAGHLVADSSPEELRARAARTEIRYPLPNGTAADELPPSLAAHVDREHHELRMQTDDVAASLDALVTWAHTQRVDLGSLAIGRPSLEDAYLSLTGSARV
jgi:ABC-2 type transport system ATP-binding protein